MLTPGKCDAEGPEKKILAPKRKSGKKYHERLKRWPEHRNQPTRQHDDKIRIPERLKKGPIARQRQVIGHPPPSSEVNHHVRAAFIQAKNHEHVRRNCSQLEQKTNYHYFSHETVTGAHPLNEN